MSTAVQKVDAKAIMGEVLMEYARKDERVVLVSTDSGNRSGFTEFISTYPERYYELGIMEQAAIGVSSGFAVAGKLPVFCAPAPFVTARPFEIFKIDLGYMHMNAKMIGRNCGFNYSDLGPTHYGLEDYALIRLIPGVAILAPQDAGELRAALCAMMDYEGPVYMRLSTAPLPELFETKPFEIGKGRVLREGKDVAVLTTGEITANVLDAVQAITTRGYDPMIIGLPTISPLDTDLVVAAARKTGKLVTVEEHFRTGGLGTAVSEVCSELCPVPVKRIAVPDEYISSGPYDVMMRNFGLDAAGIAGTVLDFLGN